MLVQSSFQIVRATDTLTGGSPDFHKMVYNFVIDSRNSAVHICHSFADSTFSYLSPYHLGIAHNLFYYFLHKQIVSHKIGHADQNQTVGDPALTCSSDQPSSCCRTELSFLMARILAAAQERWTGFSSYH